MVKRSSSQGHASIEDTTCAATDSCQLEDESRDVSQRCARVRITIAVNYYCR